MVSLPCDSPFPSDMGIQYQQPGYAQWESGKTENMEKLLEEEEQIGSEHLLNIPRENQMITMRKRTRYLAISPSL